MPRRAAGGGAHSAHPASVVFGLALTLNPFRPLVGQTSALESGGKDTTNRSAIALSYTVPEAPALTFLGLSSAKMTRASTPKDFGAALLSAIDSTGKIQNGFALGATLWSLVPGATVGLGSYQHNRLAYLFANTQLSLGAVRTSGDTAATNVAVGVRTTLVDHSDPMTDNEYVDPLTRVLDRCIKARQGPSHPLHPTPPSGAPQPAILERATSRLDSLEARVAALGGEVDSLGAQLDTARALACAGVASDSLRKSWLARHWNALSVGAGVAYGWRYPQSTFRDSRALGWSGWATAGVPFGHAVLGLIQIQYDHRNSVDTVPSSNFLTYGARVLGGTDYYDVFLEGVGLRRLNAPAGVSTGRTEWTTGVEFKVAADSWLSMGLGRRPFAEGQPDRFVVIANIRWGISSGPRFKSLADRST